MAQARHCSFCGSRFGTLFWLSFSSTVELYANEPWGVENLVLLCRLVPETKLVYPSIADFLQLFFLLNNVNSVPLDLEDLES